MEAGNADSTVPDPPSGQSLSGRVPLEAPRRFFGQVPSPKPAQLCPPAGFWRAGTAGVSAAKGSGLAAGQKAARCVFSRVECVIGKERPQRLWQRAGAWAGGRHGRTPLAVADAPASLSASTPCPLRSPVPQRDVLDTFTSTPLPSVRSVFAAGSVTPWRGGGA